MKLFPVTHPAFRAYGRIIDEICFDALVEAMAATPCPSDAVIYAPSDSALEALPVATELQNRIFGELPIQVGYCNGNNRYLNAVEYHHTSEVNVAATDMVLLLGRVQDITPEQTYETAKMEAFFVPRGIAVELYATTLHYAPCSAEGKNFRVTVVLPKDTNLPLTCAHDREGEDRLITARNKWLIGHPEGGFAGTERIGLLGKNLCVDE